MASRGQHLVNADRAFATGAGFIGRLTAPAFAKVLDQLDARLASGGIHATLPDGTKRRIGFHAPGFEPQVTLHSWMALVRLATSGSVGWYKAWAKREWSSSDPVQLFALFMANAESLGGAARAKGPMRLVNALAHKLRDNGLTQAKDNIAAHYDLGNDFYRAWLDETMTYSSGVGEGDLATMQHCKSHMILDRLELQPGMRLLEIGCGWGSLAIAAAKRGVRVVGLTLSREQKDWAEATIARENLTHLVEIRLQDYREIDEPFDAIVSVEMVEAVGERWWPEYVETIARCLRSGGRAALQLISIRHPLFEDYARSADFIQAYIFPGGCLIDEPQLAAISVERGLSWQDRKGFGLDYARTLKLWRERYDAAVRDGRLSEFSPEFHDLWRYYLMYCEGGFRGGGIDVAQVTLVKASG